jgi:hypothetical protein
LAKNGCATHELFKILIDARELLGFTPTGGGLTEHGYNPDYYREEQLFRDVCYWHLMNHQFPNIAIQITRVVGGKVDDPMGTFIESLRSLLNDNPPNRCMQSFTTERLHQVQLNFFSLARDDTVFWPRYEDEEEDPENQSFKRSSAFADMCHMISPGVDTLRFVLEGFPYMLLTHAAPPQSHTHTTAQYYLKLAPLVALSESHCETRNKIHNDSLSKFLECDRVGREAVQVTFEFFLGLVQGTGTVLNFKNGLPDKNKSTLLQKICWLGPSVCGRFDFELWLSEVLHDLDEVEEKLAVHDQNHGWLLHIISSTPVSWQEVNDRIQALNRHTFKQGYRDWYKDYRRMKANGHNKVAYYQGSYLKSVLISAEFYLLKRKDRGDGNGSRWGRRHCSSHLHSQ